MSFYDIKNKIIAEAWRYKWVFLAGVILSVYGDTQLPTTFPIFGGDFMATALRWLHVVGPVSAAIYSIRKKFSLVKKLLVYGCIGGIIYFIATLYY